MAMHSLMHATLIALLSASVCGDLGLRRSHDWTVESRNQAGSFLERGNSSSAQVGSSSQVATGPYRPGGIVDPFSDINCEAEACAGKQDSCPDFPYRLCRTYTNCESKVCLHKQLFPMLQEDLLLFIVMFIIAVCAGAAGIGGGGLNVPVLMMINSFGIKEAVPLSHAAVMGNAFAQLMFNGRQTHPTAPNRPLIHYELAILALPAQLGGNSLGVVIGRVFPPTLLIILSLAMLALAATKTFIKGIEELKKFRAKRPVVSQVSIADLTSLSPMPPQPARAGSHSPPSSPTLNLSVARNPSNDLRLPTVNADMECVRTWSGTNLLPRGMSLEQTPSHIQSARTLSNQVLPDTAPPAAPVAVRIPWMVIGAMVAFNIVFCLDFLAMSPDVFDVVKCSIPYWFALFGLYPFVIASLYVGVRSLQGLKNYHEERHDPPVTGDPEVTMKLIIAFPLAAAVIGIVAGLVGLGGGEFMVPLLLEFGLMPRVASGTSGFLILFATSSNIVHYFVADIVQPFLQYAVGVFCLAFLGAAVGLSIRDTKYMRENAYLLVFLLAGLLAVSGGLLGYRGFGISALDWGFKPFCA